MISRGFSFSRMKWNTETHKIATGSEKSMSSHHAVVVGVDNPGLRGSALGHLVGVVGGRGARCRCRETA
jgi:hypothetical protein